jgi:hemerythrin superfamily protein
VTGATRSPVAELLERDHRRLDDLFGQFLAAPDRDNAARAIAAFDQALRRHTRIEDEQLFPSPADGKLAARSGESEREQLFRELRLEHVQIRELSGMVVRRLGEDADARGAYSLAPNLARRWEAHTAREEKEVFPLLSELGSFRATALRKALEAER